MHYTTGPAFYSVAAIAIVIFCLGSWGVIHLWMLGKKDDPESSTSSPKWYRTFLKAILAQSQILEYGVLPWIAHIMIFYGFFSLLLLTTFEFVLTWLMPPHWIHTLSVISYFKDGTGKLLFAVWGDLWGIVLLAGIILALYRRYIIKPEKFDTISEDSIAIWFLFVLTLTGFACEAVRLAVRPDASDAVYSFAVYWTVPVLKSFNWTETHLKAIFYFHGILSFLFIAYIPFSKFRHIFASPVVYSFTSTAGYYTKKQALQRVKLET